MFVNYLKFVSFILKQVCYVRFVGHLNSVIVGDLIRAFIECLIYVYRRPDPKQNFPGIWIFGAVQQFYMQQFKYLRYNFFSAVSETRTRMLFHFGIRPQIL